MSVRPVRLKIIRPIHYFEIKIDNFLKSLYLNTHIEKQKHRLKNIQIIFLTPKMIS